MEKARAGRNRTLTLTDKERDYYSGEITRISNSVDVAAVENKLVNQDTFEVIELLPHNFVDLLILDPLYNLTKTFESATFRKRGLDEYREWFEHFLVKLLPLLKNTASV
jgi:site-specific DNA-methyltransferase (adenine-specific)